MSSSTSRVITDTTRRSNLRLQRQLKVSILLTDMHDNLLAECLSDLVRIFGGIRALFTFLARFAELPQINSMHQLIKTIKVKDDQKARSHVRQLQDAQDTPQSADDDSHTDNIDADPFLSLPNVSLSHICDFLMRDDLLHFTFVSRQIAIVCLEELAKTTLKTLDANSLIYSDRFMCHFSKHPFHSSRHRAETRWVSLQQEWAGRYCIAPENQLVVDVEYCAFIDLSDPSRLSDYDEIDGSRFLIFDLRNMVVLDARGARLMNTRSQIEFDDYFPLVVEYFDILRQHSSVVQFLLCHREDVSRNNFFDYIEHSFVNVAGMDNEWHEQLSLMLKQMESVTDHDRSKLCMFRHRPVQALNRFTHDPNQPLWDDIEMSCTLQLEHEHWYFFQQDSGMFAAKSRFRDRMEAFHNKAIDFYETTVDASIRYQGHIDSAIQAAHMYSDKQDTDSRDLSDALRVFQGCTLRMSTRSLMGFVCVKIADKLQNLVSQHNIEIFQDFERPNSRPIGWREIMGGSTLHFDVVLYDTRTRLPPGQTLFTVWLHPLGAAPYPFVKQNTIAKRRSSTPSFTFRHKHRFMVGPFLEQMFQSINRADGHLLRYQHQDALNLYFKDAYAEQKDAGLTERNENITFILATVPTQYSETAENYITRDCRSGIYSVKDGDVCTESSTNYQHHLHSHRQEPADPKGCIIERVPPVHFDLYMVETAKENSTKQKLKIKFVLDDFHPQFSTDTPLAKLKDFGWVGMPLIVWIDPDKTLQHVIDNCLHEDVRPFVECSYRVIPAESIILIPNDMREAYNVCMELGNAEFIVLSLHFAADSSDSIGFPVFPKSIHDEIHGQ